MAGCFHCVRGPFGWNTRGLTAQQLSFWVYLSSQHICVPRPEKGGKPGLFPCSHILCSCAFLWEASTIGHSLASDLPASGSSRRPDLGRSRKILQFTSCVLASCIFLTSLNKGVLCFLFFVLCNECFVSMNYVWHVYAWRPRGKKKVMDLMELELKWL